MPEVAEMVIDGVNELPTDTVMAFEMAVSGEAQELLLVITQVTTSLFSNRLLENVLLFVPVLTPLTRH